MAMTAIERKVKYALIEQLSSEGYPRYAKMLEPFDLKYTNDPNVVAYIDYKSGRVVLNTQLYLSQISFVLRHELLHNFLAHHKRMQKKIANELGYDYNHLTPEQENHINLTIYGDPDRIDNIAADYEISNRGYTVADKKTARTLKLGDRVVQGLVTDMDHPDWVEDNMETMYDKLRKERPQNQNDNEDNEIIVINGTLLDDETFVDENGNPINPEED